MPILEREWACDLLELHLYHHIQSDHFLRGRAHILYLSQIETVCLPFLGPKSARNRNCLGTLLDSNLNFGLPFLAGNRHSNNGFSVSLVVLFS